MERRGCVGRVTRHGGGVVSLHTLGWLLIGCGAIVLLGVLYVAATGRNGGAS